MPMTRDELIMDLRSISGIHYSDGDHGHKVIAETIALLAEPQTPKTCAACKWFRESGPTATQPLNYTSICTKEPSEWPMHWRETWPNFGCIGWEAVS